MSSPDQKPPLETFLEQYWKDKETEAVRALHEYLVLFPGDEIGIALEFAGLRQATGATIRPSASEDRIGPYRTLRELGRGGQGVVYLAEDTRLPRRVALKVLSGSGPGAETQIRRFRREAEVASKLAHPGICGVIDSGVEHGFAYIAMPFIEGETLSARIAAMSSATGGEAKTSMIDFRTEGGAPRPATVAEDRAPASAGSGVILSRNAIGGILVVFEKIARALHAAHEAGIVHRDVKPGNIIVSRSGEPVILDFGMAHDDDESQRSLTQIGDLVGTPAYMSPEQLAGQRVRVDRRSDVYSLGATLYECLTLRRPFEAPTREALYQAIMTKEPADSRRLNPSIPPDLGVVIGTALAKDRDRRYQTGLDFAEDLRRVRCREPVAAKPVGPFGRSVRWAQRNPVVAALGSALFVALISGLVVSLVLYADAGAERDRANSNLDAYNRLADARILEDLLREQEEELWPAVPDKVPAMEAWLCRARALAKTLPVHEATLADLRRSARPYSATAEARDRASHRMEWDQLGVLEAASHRIRQALDDLAASSLPEARKVTRKEELEEELQAADEKHQAERRRLEPVISERLTWEFDDPTLQRQWRHDKLSDLVKGLRSFAGSGTEDSGISDMESRLEFARTLRRRTLDDHAPAWKSSLDRVGRNPKYAPGTLPVPQLGLIPLGPDPETLLEEFGETSTGDPPVRDPSTGKLVVTERMSLVFVLLPGGKFTMGAQALDPGSPNYDPQAEEDDGPPHEVTLAPFFLSKYEMTQGQWLRCAGSNPSQYFDTCGAGHTFDLRHPVENVSWDMCASGLRRLALGLPTEAQWEFGGRAGTGTPWETGTEAASLAGSANIAGDEYQSHHDGVATWEAGFEDGWAHHAPVDGRRPNRFGLHDMHGNVWEWCEDGFGRYGVKPRPGDGLRLVPGARHRVLRGGSFIEIATRTRSAFRFRFAPSFRERVLGVRPAKPISTF